MLISTSGRGPAQPRPRTRTALFLATCLTVGLAGPGIGRAGPVVRDRPWPSTQASLGLEADGFDSYTSAQAALPGHLVITPPAPRTPADLKIYSGRWSGWMCPGRSTDMKVAFTRVGPKAATAVIAWADAAAAPGHATRRLSLKGGEFRSNGAGGLYKFRLRTFDERVGVQTMDVMVVRSAASWCAGVLRKDTPG